MTSRAPIWSPLVMIAAVSACSAAAPPMVIHGGGSLAPPPQSLAALAATVRAANGHVFVGEVDGAIVELDPVLSPPAYYDLRVSYPRAAAVVRVVDSLGATMDSSVMVSAPSGPATLVDPAGNPASGYVLEQDDPGAWMARALPPAGARWVFFVYVDGAYLATTWRAALNPDGSVDGAGTIGAEDVGLQSLHL